MLKKLNIQVFIAKNNIDVSNIKYQLRTVLC